VNEEKMHVAYVARPENDSRRITEEEESHAPEHWKDTHFPGSHPHRSGPFSR
jgi:hypothetical protein